MDSIINIANDYSMAKSKIRFRVVNKNYRNLKRVPFKKVCDFYIIFYVVVDGSGSQQISMTINDDIANRWGVNADELYEVALQNSPVLDPIRIKSVVDVLDEFGIDDLWKHRSDFFYIVSTKSMVNGFSALFYPGTLRALKEKFGDYKILPSSVHEALIIPEEMDVSKDLAELFNMVSLINMAEVDPPDRVSDNVYWYEPEKGLVAYK